MTPDQKPKLVVAVVVRRGDKILLVKELLEDGKKCWIVPGGKVEFGESLEDAAMREILEETGIVAKKLKFLSYFEAIRAKVKYHTVIFFFETRTHSVKLSEDIEGKVLEAAWFTKAEALKLPLVFSAEWLLKEVL